MRQTVYLRLTLYSLALLLLLSACSQADLTGLLAVSTESATAPAAPATESASTAANASKASAAVEAYLNALVSKNRRQYTSLICADWQPDAAVEFDSFGAVGASLQGVNCSKATAQGDSAVVSCKGNIVINYNGRIRNLSLEKRAYRAKLENGTWKMCGYQ